MTKPQDTDSIEKATDQSWTEWMTWLNKIGAGNLTHTEIARLVHERLDGQVESPGWWAQSITVAYEQASGRRAPGQRSDGSFEVSVSKTKEGSREAVFADMQDMLIELKECTGVQITAVKTSITPVRSYWKASLIDGSRVVLSIEQKTENKTLIVITHTKLQTVKATEEWRAYWKLFMKEGV